MQRREHVLVLRRDDHKRDAIGRIFLGAITSETEMRAVVERYLGPPFVVRGVEVGGSALRVHVECSRFPVESQNLSRMAKSLADRGRLRAAADSFGEALKLDPLNVEALKGHAALAAIAGDLEDAEDKWIRAGEVRGYDGETLRALAAIALRSERRATAMQYLEEALLVNPDDADTHAILDELHRQAELRFNQRTTTDDE